MSFGDKLRALLKESGRTSKSLATRCQAKGASVSAWLAGDTYPQFKNIVDIKDYFGEDLNWLLDDRLEWSDRPSSRGDSDLERVRRAVRELDDAALIRILHAGIETSNSDSPG